MKRRPIITLWILGSLIAIVTVLTSPLSPAQSTALEQIQSRLIAEGARTPRSFNVEALATLSDLIEDYLRALAPSHPTIEELSAERRDQLRRLFESHARHWHPLVKTMMIRRLIETREERRVVIGDDGKPLHPRSDGPELGVLRKVLLESLPATFREGTQSPSAEVRIEIMTRMSAALEIALDERSIYREVRLRLRQHGPSADLAMVCRDLTLRIVGDTSLPLATRHGAFAKLTRVLSMMRTDASADALLQLFHTLDQFVELSEMAMFESLLIDQIVESYLGAYHWEALDGDEVFEFIHYLVLSLESETIVDHGEPQNARNVKALVAALTPRSDLLRLYIEIYHADDPSELGGLMAHLADMMFDLAEADALLPRQIRCSDHPYRPPRRNETARIDSGPRREGGTGGAGSGKPSAPKRRVSRPVAARDRSLPLWHDAIRRPLPEQISELMGKLGRTLEEMKETLPPVEIPPSHENVITRAYAYFEGDPRQVESNFGVESADLFFQHILRVIWFLTPLLDPAEIHARILMPMGSTSDEELALRAQEPSGFPTCEMMAYLSSIRRRAERSPAR